MRELRCGCYGERGCETVGNGRRKHRRSGVKQFTSRERSSIIGRKVDAAANKLLQVADGEALYVSYENKGNHIL